MRKVQLKTGKRPPVAEARTKAAERRILAGVRALGRVQSSEGARKAVARGWPRTVEEFRRWKKLGNDTLHRTHARHKPAIEAATRRLADLAVEETKPSRRQRELGSLRAKAAQSEETASALATDLLLLSMDRDNERRMRMHYERELYGAEAANSHRRVAVTFMRARKFAAHPHARGPFHQAVFLVQTDGIAPSEISVWIDSSVPYERLEEFGRAELARHLVEVAAAVAARSSP